MRIHHDASEVYPTEVPAQGRCSLCGSLFEFGPVEYTFESSAGEAFGNACPGCAKASPDELKRRMLSWSRMMRSMAEELEGIAGEIQA